jgi:hypothetical protein
MAPLASAQIEPLTALAFSILQNRGVYCLLLGSGLSRAAQIPTGWDITLDLVARLARVEGADDEPDLAAWYHAKYGKAPRYSDILDALAKTPDERRAILHAYIEPDQEDIEAGRKVPTKAHRAVAALVRDGFIRVTITTNFDRLLENALRDVGVEPTVITSEDDLKGAVPLVHSRCYVVKLHGDYLDTRIRNTESELGSYSKEIDGLLDRIFDEHGLLICGWSGDWDTALRAAIARTPSRRYPVYWAARGTPTGLATDLIAQRGAAIVPIVDADAFLTRLASMVNALGQGARAHPQSVAGALALAKKYCRDDKFDAEWHDFLSEEVAKFRTFVTGHDYPKGAADDARINALVGQIVGRTEIARRVALTSVRWGTRKAQQATAKAVTSLALSHTIGSGSYYWISLADFGASLSFTWAIAGAMANDDYVAVRRFMYAPFSTRSGSEVPAIDRLPPQTLENVDWKKLSGLERHKTPVSDFMYGLFQSEAADLLMNPADAEELFDRTEFLITLEFAHHRLQRMEKSGLWFWAPVGRYVWKGDDDGVAKRLTEIEQQLAADSPHLKAGLLGGTSESALAAVNAFRGFLKEIRGSLF